MDIEQVTTEYLTIKEVSAMHNVNFFTIWRIMTSENDARRLAEFPGAYQEQTGNRVWRIPASEAAEWRPCAPGERWDRKQSKLVTPIA